AGLGVDFSAAKTARDFSKSVHRPVSALSGIPTRDREGGRRAGSSRRPGVADDARLHSSSRADRAERIPEKNEDDIWFYPARSGAAPAAGAAGRAAAPSPEANRCVTCPRFRGQRGAGTTYPGSDRYARASPILPQRAGSDRNSAPIRELLVS